MRKSLWMIPVLLLFAAIGVPSAHADDIVQVAISNLAFNGNFVCGLSGTAQCTQTLNATFQWDNTSNTEVGGSLQFTTSGALGSSFTAGPFSSPVDFSLSDTEGDVISLDLAETAGQLTPGSYPPESNIFQFAPGTSLDLLGCGSPDICSTDYGLAFVGVGFPFVGAIAEAGNLTVTAVPEPPMGITLGAGLLSLMGMTLFRKRALS
jgi:hypothetical protein